MVEHVMRAFAGHEIPAFLSAARSEDFHPVRARYLNCRNPHPAARAMDEDAFAGPRSGSL